MTVLRHDPGDPDRGHGRDHDHGALTTGADEPVRILFVCWGNSARSLLGEALMRHLGGDRVEAHSAGIEPAGVHPLTLRVLAEAGVDATGLRSKSVDEYLGQRFDYVITVCDDARGACPVFPGVAESMHWGYPDPARVEGTDEARLAAFRSVFTGLGGRIHQFLPIAERFAAQRRPVELR
jgi:arsenate reductase (thioredoxin)